VGGNLEISLAAVNVPPEAMDYVMDTLRRGRLSQSEYVERFEKALTDWTGAKHAIAVSSGTMADAVALGAMKIKHHHNRVVCPALTFVAQPNAARMNEMDIEFVDVSEDWTMSVEQAERWRELAIAYPSDCMGRLARIPSGMPCVEDACEAFGSTLDGRRAGRFGEIGTYSFFVSHTLTTGEGGAIVTDDDWLADLCRTLRSHGRASDSDAMQKFRFPFYGFNAKMTGVIAAVGCGLMEHVDEYVNRRRQVFKTLNELMDNRFTEREGEIVIPHGYPLEFEGQMRRDEAMRLLLDEGIECRKFFSSIPSMEPAYAHLRRYLGRYPVAEYIAQTHLYLPCHQNLTQAQIERMAAVARSLPFLSKPRI